MLIIRRSVRNRLRRSITIDNYIVCNGIAAVQGTVVVRVRVDMKLKCWLMRASYDPGSEVNLITVHAVHLLNIIKDKAHTLYFDRGSDSEK